MAEAAKAPGGTPDDGAVFARLMENYKNRLPIHLRGFVGMAKGRLSDGVLTVYCVTDEHRHMLDAPEVAATLADVTAQAVGGGVTVRFLTGEPEGEKHDKMLDLLQIGSTFGSFEAK